MYGVKGYKVELFFHLASKWPKWCAQTLHPFSQILKIFSLIGALIVARHLATIFKSVLSVGKGFSSPKNAANPSTKSAYKHRRYLLLNNTTASLATGKRPSVIYEKKEKHHTSSSHADMRSSISTKFCFWVPSIV